MSRSHIRSSSKHWDGKSTPRALLVLSWIALAPALIAGLSRHSFGADEPTSGAQKVDVDTIREKYWARGDESELGVVQNRAYSKKSRFEFGLIGGVTTTDPFLTVKTLGAHFGFHFSEYIALHAVGWKSYVSPSSALLTFQDTIGATTNNNPPQWFLGGELGASFLYGKLSLIGKAIIYYDMHLTGGLGATSTESGTNITPYIGIGQQVFLSKFASIRVDYRLMRYNEKIVEKVITPKLGQEVGTRVNWTNAISFGVDFFFGGGSSNEGSPQ